jgi:GTPase SAR1 family protein
MWRAIRRRTVANRAAPDLGAGTTVDLLRDFCADSARRLDGDAASFMRRVERGLAERRLRLAVVGRVSSGKSTLVNALLGRQVAPTDAGECTRSIICYRYGDHPATLVHLRNGTTIDLTSTSPGRAPADLPVPAELVGYVEVRLDVDSLLHVTVLDSPGISSVNADISRLTHELVSDQRTVAPDPDAIAFVLTRNVRADENSLLQEIDASNSLVPAAVHTVGVLTKTDLLAGGGVDAWDSARTLSRSIAEAHRGSFSAVVPVKGLLAEAGNCRLLTDGDAEALSVLAGEWGPADREMALLDSSLFIEQPSTVGADVRRRLVGLVGLAGVRELLEAVSAGTAGADQLNAVCRGSSGSAEVLSVLGSRFGEPAEALKVGRALATLDRAVHGWVGRSASAPTRMWMRDRLEEIRLDRRTHRVHELEALHKVLGGQVELPEVFREDLEQIVQYHGLPPHALGVGAWQEFESTAESAGQRAVARVVVRSHALAAGRRAEER